MIGNLFTALCLAGFSGALVCGDINSSRVKPVSMGNSWVNGSSCDVYYTSSIHQNLLSSNTYGSYDIYDYSGNLIDNDSMTAIEDYDTYLNGFSVVANNTNDSFMFAYQTLNNPQTINNLLFRYCFRVGVPVNSAVNGFEFRCNTDVIVFQYSALYGGVFIPSSYLAKGQTFQTSIGVYDNGKPVLDNDYVIPSSIAGTDNGFLPLRFSNYLFYFASQGVTRTEFNLEFQLINGGADEYMTGYNSGYKTGYDEGLAVGYGNGYAEGLSVASGSTFRSLFGALADTPLRFLYGLFNFDLFGISALVIVLSLLTGIVVIGVVRKFWR